MKKLQGDLVDATVGSIVDPVGIGQLAVGAPNTGINPANY